MTGGGRQARGRGVSAQDPSSPRRGRRSPASGGPEAAATTSAARLAAYLQGGGVIVPLLTAVLAFFVGGLVILITGHNPISTYKAIFNGTGLNWIFPWVIERRAHDRGAQPPADADHHHAADPHRARGRLRLPLRAVQHRRPGPVPRRLLRRRVGRARRSPACRGCCTSCSRWSSPPLAGAVWAGIAGLLKAVVGAHEVISTIMLNWIAIWVGAYLFQLNGPLQNSDPTQQSVPVSSDVAASAKLPVFWGDPELQGLHIGIFIALAAAVVFWVLLNRSTTGYEVRAVGFNPEAARYGGISVVAQLHPGHGRVRRLRRAGGVGGPPRLAVPHRHQRHPQISATSAWASSASPSPCSAATRPAARWWRRCCSAPCSPAPRSATSTRRSSSPSSPANLTLIIQGLVVLIVSADVIVLTMLRRGRGIFRRTPAGPRRRAAPPRRRRRVSTAVATAAPARAAGAPRGLGRHRAGLRRLVHHAAAGARAHPGAVDPHRPAGDDRRRAGPSAAASSASAGARSSPASSAAPARWPPRSRAPATSRTSSRGRRWSRRRCATPRR